MNNNNFARKQDYYIPQEVKNGTFVWGIKSSDETREKSTNQKLVIHPDVLSGVYTIDQDGNVYNTIEDVYITWDYKKYPYVNLLNKNNELISVYIKDLMAYSFLDNAKDYLERGWRVVNIDGNYSNCNYKNIIFINDGVV